MLTLRNKDLAIFQQKIQLRAEQTISLDCSDYPLPITLTENEAELLKAIYSDVRKGCELRRSGGFTVKFIEGTLDVKYSKTADSKDDYASFAHISDKNGNNMFHFSHPIRFAELYTEIKQCLVEERFIDYDSHKEFFDEIEDNANKLLAYLAPADLLRQRSLIQLTDAQITKNHVYAQQDESKLKRKHYDDDYFMSVL